MNLKTAGAASLVGFVLSFLVALLAGVPLLEVFFRAVIWGVVLGGLAVGAEFLLRSQLPDLFSPVAEPAPETEEARGGESVNIVLDEDVGERPFVEEIVEQSSDDAPEKPYEPAVAPVARPMVPSDQTAPAPSAAGGDEPLEEIGSFLNSFRPQSSEEREGEAGEAAGGESPDIADYAPRETSELTQNSSAYAPSRGADLEGMEQDPSVLAKAIKTVMNKT